MSLASLPSFWWRKRAPPKRVAAAAAMLFCAVNICSAATFTYPILIVLRLCSGLAAGTLMIVAMLAAAKAQNAERAFGMSILAQLLAGSLGLLILPQFMAQSGVSVFYACAACAILCALPLVRFLPGAPNAGADTRNAHAPLPWTVPVIAVGAAFLFYAAISGVWAFMGTIGAAAGLDPVATARQLGIASLFGIVGAASSILVKGERSRKTALSVGYPALIMAILLSVGMPGPVRFVICAVIFKFMWTFLLPLILAAISSRDHSGKLLATVNLAIGSGLAVGPLIFGALTASLSTSSAIMASALLLSISAPLLANLLTPLRRVIDPD